MTFGGKLKKKCLCKDPQVVKSRRRIFAKADLKKSVLENLILSYACKLVNAVNWI